MNSIFLTGHYTTPENRWRGMYLASKKDLQFESSHREDSDERSRILY